MCQLMYKASFANFEATCYVDAFTFTRFEETNWGVYFFLTLAPKDLPNLGPDGIFRLAASHKSLIVPSFHLPLKKASKEKKLADTLWARNPFLESPRWYSREFQSQRWKLISSVIRHISIRYFLIPWHIIAMDMWKIHNLNPIMRIHQTNPNRGTFYTVTGQYCFKRITVMKNKMVTEDGGTLPNLNYPKLVGRDSRDS